MQDKLNIAVFVDYDNIEIGLKSTLRREFDVSLALDALKERGDLVAKFAYANWGRQDGATRQMAENAVQMVQRIPSPRGDKNGADINLALDALEMAFTHTHVNAFAIVSGDSDFIPLVNKLKEYGKTVFVVGGKAFTSTILQQNCHEFISYESLLMVSGDKGPQPDKHPVQAGGGFKEFKKDRDKDFQPKEKRQRPAPLPLEQAMPLVERALQVLERRGVQPQLGLLKSTMLQ
ncbi:MAG TPA: NYN domain-containing protein, partial [Bryobacteraceae bacterium]|nr:NYN domain-containing protein [Bryobacteraceae bacterium]